MKFYCLANDRVPPTDFQGFILIKFSVIVLPTHHTGVLPLEPIL